MNNPSSPPVGLRQRVLDAARAEPAMTRRGTRLANLGMLVAGAVGLGLLSWQLGFAQGTRPGAFVLGTSAGWILAALTASWIALGRGGRMGGRPSRVLLATTVLTPLLLMGWLLAWNSIYRPEQCDAGVSSWGVACHELIVAMSAVMFIAFAAIRRFGDPVHPRIGGAALGTAAACWSGLVLNLRCTCAAPQHVALGHVLPILVTSVAGIGLGWWLLRLRTRSAK